ncbi:MAG: hypothetical protein E6Q68_01545 [Polynucleobacter sp.]|nr:MAG: hypothetical protein E6Q68_01545 [Polynucleobacter sp.]
MSSLGSSQLPVDMCVSLIGFTRDSTANTALTINSVSVVHIYGPEPLPGPNQMNQNMPASANIHTGNLSDESYINAYRFRIAKTVLGGFTFTMDGANDLNSPAYLGQPLDTEFGRRSDLYANKAYYDALRPGGQHKNFGIHPYFPTVATSTTPIISFTTDIKPAAFNTQAV